MEWRSSPLHEDGPTHLQKQQQEQPQQQQSDRTKRLHKSVDRAQVQSMAHADHIEGIGVGSPGDSCKNPALHHMAAAASLAVNLRKQQLSNGSSGSSSKCPPTPPPQSTKPVRRTSTGDVMPTSPSPILPRNAPLNSSISNITSPHLSSTNSTPRTMNHPHRSSLPSNVPSPRTSANFSPTSPDQNHLSSSQTQKARPPIPARNNSQSSSPCTSPINEKPTRSLSTPIPQQLPPFQGLTKPKSMTACSTMMAKRFLKNVIKDSEDSSDEEDEDIAISAPPGNHLNSHSTSSSTANRLNDEGCSQRTYQVQEILASERKYINNLNRIMTIYLLPLRDKATTKDKILSMDEINQIFSNIDFIFNLHKTFLVDFESRISNWSDTQRIGDIFRGIAPCLNAYTLYANSFNPSIVLLNNLEKTNSHFKAFLAKCLAKPASKGLNLSGYLIQPIQRVPRYKLMLERLISETSSDHVDYNDLTISLKDINALAVKMEERMEQFQTKNKVFEIQNNLIGYDNDIVQPSRVFVMEGDLKKISNRVVNTRHFFLFNDLLIYAQREGKDQYRYKQTLPLEKCWVKDIPSTARFGHLFQILEPTKTYFLNAPSELEKQTWMQKLNDVINKLVVQLNCLEQRQQWMTANEKRGVSSPKEVLQDLETLPKDNESQPNPTRLKDQLVKDCMSCSASFAMRRRRHCRKCGKIFCTECCPITDLSQYLPGSKVRMCKSCFEEISVHIEVMIQNQSLSDNEQTTDQSTYDNSSSCGSPASLRYSRGSHYSIEEGHHDIYD